MENIMDMASTPAGKIEAQIEPHVHLYQIAYSKETLAAVEEGFISLDNTENRRPDWFEYWPIRNFLLSNELKENEFYGFFSTKFRLKTGLSAQQVVDFVRQCAARADVISFSPQPDMGSFFLNSFEQAEAFDSGMISTYEAVLAQAGLAIPLGRLVMDSRQIVFSNYFVARPAFWRAWLHLNELIFRLAEDYDHPLGAELRTPTNYGDGAQRKVFLQERTASFLLSTEQRWTSLRYNPFKLAWSATALNAFPTEAVISDALKIAFRDTNDHEYIEAYNSIRQKVIASPSASSAMPQATSALSLSTVVSIAETLTTQGLFEEARQIYEVYLTAPTDGLAFVVHHNLAVILRSLGMQAEALSHFQRCTELNPNFAAGYLNHGTLLEQLNKSQEAITVWQAGVDKSQGDDRIKLLNNIGRLKEIGHDYEGAENALKESLEIDTQQGPVLHHWIHLRQKQCRWPVLDDRLKPLRR